MLTRRFVIDSIVAVVIAIALFVSGWASADWVLQAVLASGGIDRLFFADEASLASDLFWNHAGVALALMLPVLVAWVAALIDRTIGRADPPVWRLGAYLMVATVGVAIGVVRTLSLARFMRSEMAGVGIEMPIGIDAIGLAPRAVTWGLLAGALLCGVVALLALRARKH